MTVTLTDVEFASAGGATTLTLGPDAVSALVEALAPHVAPTAQPSPYMTIVEAAEFLRAPRHRVDGLLSARKLTRYKDGSRTLVSREEVEAHVRSAAATGPRALADLCSLRKGPATLERPGP